MTELREYMLFCISRDIQASEKDRLEEQGIRPLDEVISPTD